MRKDSELVCVVDPLQICVTGEEKEDRSRAACFRVPSIYTNYTKPWTNLQLECEVAAKGG